jgi:hypothetical protein
MYKASNMPARVSRRSVGELLRQGYAVSQYEHTVLTQSDQ